MAYELVKDSIAYLSSTEAQDALLLDAYWPKWHSPWWHMLLLHEMGETKQIPAVIVDKFVKALNKYPLKIFPINEGELPDGICPSRGYPCHCQLGNVYQVLAAFDVDVDQELPWIRQWFLRYQMADGGLNCDNDAYLVKDEVPSSMVGSIAAFEAMLLYTKDPWIDEEKGFIDKGAYFLIQRKLMHGSSTKHNAEERSSAENWLKPCFPRFYQYDALRGLNALTLWAERTKQKIPAEAIRDVVRYFEGRFHDGCVRNERRSLEGIGTLFKDARGDWIKQQAAIRFPLLSKVSGIGEVSPYLSKQWADIKERLSRCFP